MYYHLSVSVYYHHPIVMVGYVMRAELGGGVLVGWENNMDHIDSVAPRWSHFILPIEAALLLSGRWQCGCTLGG